ncbi:MAG: hypothetical protein EP330_05960 [Deltaproteobacteria bacterium]|nr:MAG: hypothetical protein EP330_05960 [Deltaproteobacteria bacterium]
MRTALLLAILSLAACKKDDTGADTDNTSDTDTGEVVTDLDGDGSPAGEDCDDDPSECGEDCFPGNTAPDNCDGYDNDCDGLYDEDEGETYYADCDGDGEFSAVAVTGCGESNVVSPCADGQAPDGGYTSTAPSTADCDDEDATQNHDDADSDGVSTCDGDCDDDPSGCGADCFPGNTASDTCDDTDADCDGTIGEDDGRTWYADCDGDGEYAATGVSSCDEPTTSACADGQAPDGGWWPVAPTTPDCDDEDATQNHDDADSDGVTSCDGDCDDDPAACGSACSPDLTTDGCDDYDNDCDNQTDEDPDISWYLDADQDESTVGNATVQCASPGATYRAGASAVPDCDDNDPDANTRDDDGDGETTCAGDCDDDPNACGDACNTNNTTDGCGGYDNDCDQQIDENPGSTIWYLDTDGDTWVESTSGVAQCNSPGQNYTTRLSSQVDCDDSDATQNHDDDDGDGVSTCAGDCDDDPNACGAACSPSLSVDGCDGENNDCDGATDEDPPDWYEDDDQDGWTTSASTASCSSPGARWTQTRSTPTDCDDGDATLNHDDDDQDGHATCDGDCDDDPLGCGADCYPGNSAGDVCDGDDQDCDNRIDENPDRSWYRDQDEDGWSTNVSRNDCDPGAGWVRNRTTPLDCDDADAARNYTDVDGDGFNTCDSNDDCVDTDADLSAEAISAGITAADIYPGAPDAWYDGVDADCAANNDYDQDRDGYVPTAYNAFASGGRTDDCDDDPTDDTVFAADQVYPGAPEFCDGLNTDCDANTDEGSPRPAFIPADGGAYLLTDAVSTLTIDEPGELRWCSDERASAIIDSDDVTVHAVNGMAENDLGDLTWKANRTGGVLDNLALGGTLTLESGSVVTTPNQLELQGRAIVDGSWTAYSVDLAMTVPDGGPTRHPRIEVGTSGYMSGSYMTIRDTAGPTPLYVEGEVYLDSLTATGNNPTSHTLDNNTNGGVIEGATGSKITMFNAQMNNNNNTRTIDGVNAIVLNGGAIYTDGVLIIDYGLIYDNGLTAYLPSGSGIETTGSDLWIGPNGDLTVNASDMQSRVSLADAVRLPWTASIYNEGTASISYSQIRPRGHSGIGVHTLGELTVTNTSFQDSARYAVRMGTGGTVSFTATDMTNVPDESHAQGGPMACSDTGRGTVMFSNGTRDWYDSTNNLATTCDATSCVAADSCP